MVDDVGLFKALISLELVTNVCLTWSRFALQLWHSVVEFRRLLRKYFQEIWSMNDVQPADWINYTLYEFIIRPITSFLRREGVEFHFETMVTDLIMYPAGNPTTVSGIKMLGRRGVETLVTVNPKDIVILTLGSMTFGFSRGSNSEPPATISALPEDWKIGPWSLWFQLAKKKKRQVWCSI